MLTELSWKGQARTSRVIPRAILSSNFTFFGNCQFPLNRASDLCLCIVCNCFFWKTTTEMLHFLTNIGILIILSTENDIWILVHPKIR